MYQICTKTVMDTSDPGITFDSKGVSDHAIDFELHVQPKWSDLQKSGAIDHIVDRIKNDCRNQEYDCLIGLSGGLDSSYMLHMLVTRYGLRPLVFHVDGGWNTELSVHNINSLVTKLNLDLFTEVIDWEEMRDLQLAFFKSGVPHIDIPQDHAFVAALYKFAQKHNIKYIMNGGNFSTECVQYPMKFYYYGTDMRHNKDIIKRFTSKRMVSYPFSGILNHKLYLRYIKGIKVIKPLNMIEFVKKDAINELKDTYDWKPYPQKHFESRFTRFYEGYWLPKRFGFDPRRVMLSSLILTNQISREEALEILKNPALDEATAKNEFKYVADKLNISEAELLSYLEAPKKYYWDYRNSQNLFRFGASVLNLMGTEAVKKRSV